MTALLMAGFFVPALAAEKLGPRDITKGIWKSFVPRGVAGEFDSQDPVGLMAGKHIPADCSLNWKSPDTGKLYCFSSATSLVYFLQWPKTNIEKAGRFWRKDKDQAGS